MLNLRLKSYATSINHYPTDIAGIKFIIANSKLYIIEELDIGNSVCKKYNAIEINKILESFSISSTTIDEELWTRASLLNITGDYDSAIGLCLLNCEVFFYDYMIKEADNIS